MLDKLWFRYTLIFIFFTATMAVMPGPIPWIGAVMWVMAAAISYYKVNDRPQVMARSLLAISGYCALLLGYRLLGTMADFGAIAKEMGVPAPQAEEVGAVWVKNVALGVLGISFLVPVYYGVYWFQMMFWDRLSRFFTPSATVEESQAVMKRGGRR